MRVGHRGADLQEDLQPLIDREATRLAILVDRQTVDVLHHEIREALAARAAVKQPRDVRMLESREDLALVSKALQHGVAIHAALDELDGGAHLELRIVALAKKDGAHAAATQLAHDAIRADVTGFRQNRRRDALDSRRRITDKGAGLGRRRAGAVRLPRAARHRRRTQPQARRPGARAAARAWRGRFPRAVASARGPSASSYGTVVVSVIQIPRVPTPCHRIHRGQSAQLHREVVSATYLPT